MTNDRENLEDLDVSSQVSRIAAALKTAVRLSGVSQRRIERELHLRTGSLTRLFAGQAKLQVSHVLAVCRVIGFPAGNFFAALFPATPPETIAEARLARGLGAPHPEPEPASDPEALLAEVRACLDHLRSLLERDIL